MVNHEQPTIDQPEEIAHRTTKRENRVRSVLQRSPLKMYTGPGALEKKPRLETVQGVSKDAVHVLEAFMGCTDPRLANILESIDVIGVTNLVSTASRLAESPKQGSKIVFRTVFGASEEMSISGLQYLLPSIYLAEALRRVEVRPNGIREAVALPKIQFLFMNEAGCRMNNIDRQRVGSTTRMFIFLAQAYVHEFHPDIAGMVCFLDDAEFTAQVMTTRLYSDLSSRLPGLLTEEAKADLFKKATDHQSNPQMAYQYAALHPLVHDGLFGTDNGEADLLVSFGAQSEKPFYDIRRLLQDRLVSGSDGFFPTSTAQYFARINVPPYGLFCEGDLSLEKAFRDPKELFKVVKASFAEETAYHVPVQQAVTRLAADSGSISFLVSFLNDLQEIAV